MVQYAATIEGVGRGAQNRLYHFCSGGIPSWDTDAVFVPSLMLWPGELTESVDLGTGRPQTGGAKLELTAGRPTQQGASVSSLLYNQSREHVGRLGASMTASSPTITLTGSLSTALEGSTIYIEREAIHLDTHTGGGTYACTRGVLGTRADSHDTNRWTGVYLRTGLDLLPWRAVTLYRVPDDATGYSDMVQGRTYLLQTIDAPSSPNILHVSLSALLQAVMEAEILRGRWTGRVNVRTSTEGTPDRVGPYTGEGTPTTTPNAWMCWDEKAVTEVAVGTRGGVTTVVYDRAQLHPRSASLQAAAQQVRECWPCSGDDSDTASLPLSRNLATLFLQLLTSTRTGDNGAYDVGSAVVGLGVDHALVDIAGVEAIRARSPLLDTDTLFLGLKKGPLKAMAWLLKQLRIHNIYIVDQGSKLGLLQLLDADVDVNSTLGADAIIDPGGAYGEGAEPGPAPGQRLPSDWQVDEAVVDYDERPGDGTIDRTVVDENRLLGGILPWGSVRTTNYDLRGYSAEAGESRATAAAVARIMRFHRKIPIWDVVVPRNRTDTVIGSRHKVTHPDLYRVRGGSRSVTDATVVVIGRREDPDQEVVRLRVAWVGALYPRTGLIGPSARVASWDAGTRTLTVDQDASAGGFASGLLTNYATDVDGFGVGYRVDLCTTRGVPVTGGVGLEVDSLDTNTITLTTTPSTTPADGMVVRLTSYGAGRPQNRYAHLSDSATPSTVATDTAYYYTLP